MSSSTSTSRTALLLIVLALIVAIVFLPGLVFWPQLFGGHRVLFAPLGLMSLLNLALAVWVGIDAERRCNQGLLWGLLVFFTSIVGLIVYLLVGPVLERRGAVDGRNEATCPSCRAAVEPSFKVCPYCGEKLERACPGCALPVQGDWRLCPQCGSRLQEDARSDGRPPEPDRGSAPAS